MEFSGLHLVIQSAMERSRQPIDRVGRISKLAVGHDELDSFAQALLQELVNDVEVKGACLCLRAEGDSELRVVANVGFSPSLGAITPSLIDRVAKSGKFEESAGAIAIPLAIRDTVSGVLAISFRSSDVWAITSRDELDSIGEIVSLAVLHLQERRETARLKWRLNTLSIANSKITQAMETLPISYLLATVQRGFQVWPGLSERAVPRFLIPVLKTILDEARFAVGAEMGALGIGNNPKETFEPWISSGMPADAAEKVGHPPRPVGTLGVVACMGETVHVKDLRQHPAFLGLPKNHPEVKSFLGIPIRYGGISLGNLYFANKQGGDEFSTEDVTTAKEFGSHAASALQLAYFHATIETNQAQIQAVLDSAPTGILFMEPKASGVFANPRAAELFGVPIPFRSGRRHIQERIIKPKEFLLDRALKGETLKAQEGVIRRDDGTEIPVLISVAPVYDYENQIIGAVASIEEISSRKELEMLRQEFVTMVVHDLRNPLQAILSEAERLIMNGTGWDSARPALHGIGRNAMRLSQMINDLLDAAKLELKQLSIEFEPVQLVEFLPTLIQQMRGKYPARQIVFTMPDEQPPKISVDPLRLEQILENLVENAFKFSDASSCVEIGIEREDKRVGVFVRDFGVGMSESDRGRVFDRFFQARRARRSHSGGLGLGLYIVKELTAAQHGTVRVESALGKGSTFHVYFPAA